MPKGRPSKVKAILDLLATGAFTIEEIAEKTQSKVSTVALRIKYSLPNAGYKIARVENNKFTLVDTGLTKEVITEAPIINPVEGE